MKPLTFSWKDVPAAYVSAEEFNNRLKTVKEMEETGKIKKTDFYTARNFVRILHTFCLCTTSYSAILRVYNNSQDYYQVIFNENRGTSVSEEPEVTGQMAYNYIENLFQEEYGYDKTLFKEFSGSKYIKEYKSIKNCVPKPVSMINPFHRNHVVDDIKKADISSAYPSEGSKKLPTLKGSKTVKGFAEPSEEYPFAFYINSHHLAIYKEFSTKSWCKSKKYYTLYDDMYNDSVTPEEEITILCKESELSLAPVFKDVYAAKIKGDPVAKLSMNAAIGWFQKTNSPRLSHLAAVIIARCCDRVMKVAKKIENKNSVVILIATDSVIWKGCELEEATDIKYLGSFTYEVHNGKFFGTGPKAYQILNDSGECITKYSGMKNTEEKSKIPFGEIPSLKGQHRYIISKDGHIEEVNWVI